GRLAGARLLVVGGSASRGPLLDMAARLGLVTDPAGHVREAVRAVRLAIQSRRPYDTVLIGSEMRAADAVAGAEQLVRAAHGACPLALIAAPGARADLMPRLEASGLAIGALLLEPVTPARLVDACLRVSGMGSLGLVPDATGAPGNAGHAGNAPTPVAGRRVLLVDDNPIEAELVLHGLVDADVAAVWARDAWQALALLESDRFDAVLLDTRLPGPDGFETGRAIRARFDSNVLPVIALSADGLWSDRSRARAAGMNDDIRKPADPLQLIETLARWLAPRA
ncbi:MAG: response regulator, partial [Pseudomonadota bacterium]|nr:response regulator [Pseudomonadota bacterium]